MKIEDRRKRQIIDGKRMGRHPGNCEICGIYRRALHANCHQDKSLDEEPISIPEERRQRISVSIKKKFKTDPGFRKKIAAAIKQRYKTPSARKLTSETTKRGLTPEVCKKRAASLRRWHQKRKKNPALNHAYMKRVKKGNYILDSLGCLGA